MKNNGIIIIDPIMNRSVYQAYAAFCDGTDESFKIIMINLFRDQQLL